MNPFRDFWERHDDTVRTILNQLGWFAMALVLAVIVWVVASTEDDPISERVFNSRIDIRLVNLDSDVLVVNDVPESARVTVRAPQSTWARLTASDIQVQADVKHARTGEQVVPLQAVMSLPGAVVGIEPSQVSVQLDVADRKTVPVIVGVTGEPAVGYQIRTPQPNPTEVTVYGPATLVSLVTEAYAEFPLNGERSDVNDTVSLTARGQGQRVDNVQIEPASVRVTVPIETREGFRSVSVLPNIPTSPPAGYIWRLESYEPVTITVTGPQSRLNNMAVPVLTDPIDLSNQTQSLEREVGVILPSGIEPAVEGQTIRVSIMIEAIEGFRQFDAVAIEPQGLTPGYRAVITPETVTVLISGPRFTVNGLMGEDVRVIVDVSGLLPDTYQLNPSVIVAREGISQEGISVLPRVVEVEIVAEGTPASAPGQPTPTLMPTSEAETPTPSP